MKDDQDKIPLLEFDPDKNAIIEPLFRSSDFEPPEYCVLPIYKALLQKLEKDRKIEKVGSMGNPYWQTIDIFRLDYQGKSLLVLHPGICAAFVVSTIERLIAWGCRKFVACGACGVLKPELKNGAVIIPGAALRDEGTSYHYLPPSRFVEMNPAVLEKLESTLKKNHIDYEIGKTWTTDAFFRETKKKIAGRKAEGCIAVEMECSAILALAKFRDVLLGQYLTASDDISGDGWDTSVDHSLSVQERLFWLSVNACLSL